ncbi:phosphoesterase [Stetteria hydrogenophila]
MSDKPRVVVIADWDADGVVSAAIIKYAQERLGIFPIKGEARVELIPSGPRGFAEALGSVGCADALVILDIPLTTDVYKALVEYRARCSGAIYYFDHHDSTLKGNSELERLGVKTVLGKSATAVLVRMFIEGFGGRLTPRLASFSDAVAILEGGSKRRLKQLKNTSSQIVGMAASISKAINVSKDREMWRRYVDWLSNPLPFEPPRFAVATGKANPIEEGMKLSKEAEEEVKKAALDLSMQAIRVGFLKFVDAEDKWKTRGATALAGEISRISGQPVALLVKRNDGVRLLIIRGHKGLPEVLADLLLKEGLVEDKGGHRNVAICRVKEGVSKQDLINALRRLSFEAWRRLESARERST